jgi:hypothetical protein
VKLSKKLGQNLFLLPLSSALLPHSWIKKKSGQQTDMNMQVGSKEKSGRQKKLRIKPMKTY